MAKKQSVPKGSAQVALLAPSASALAKFEGLFDSELTAGAAGSQGLAPFISTEDGVMKLGQTQIGKELDCVILGVAVEHTLYPGDYKKGKPSPAVCFYVGPSEEDAAPDAKSPQKQATSCSTCVKNAWGSGRGNAKACRQSRRLLILPLGPHDNPAEAPIYRLRVPPTSIKHIVQYANLLASYKRPIQSVVTRVQFQGHEVNRFEVRFNPVRPLNEQDTLQVLARRATEGKDALFASPMVSTDAGSKEPVKGGRRIVRR